MISAKSLYAKGQSGNIILPEITVNGNIYTAKILKNQLKNVKTLDFAPELFNAHVGDEGYYVCDTDGAYQTFFKERDDSEFITDAMRMPILGAVINGKCMLAVVTKMAFCYETVMKKQGENYCFFPRFKIDDNPYPHDIEVKYFVFQNGNFEKMAQIYREYLFSIGVEPIVTRKKKYPAVGYSKDAPNIRIRMGWKEAPSPIEHQTPENEPEMHVACTFSDVQKFIDKLTEKGVDKAEICLVGWNVSGHDGRWPQALPVEEKLGGEKGLRELIDYAKTKNIAITCHTNCCDAYEIAKNFRMDFVAKDKDNNIKTNRIWSGGLAHIMCPKDTYDISVKMIEDTANLGFKGLHYIDVLTINKLAPCFDERHPCSTEEVKEIYGKFAEICREKIGGFSSEEGRLYFPQYLDFALYAYWSRSDSPLLDCEIPFWQLVLNGVILSNPFSKTVNYPLKSIEERLDIAETNSRPVFYCHKNFYGENASDPNDFKISTDEERENTSNIIAKEYQEFKERAYLQEEFMTGFDFPKKGISRASFSDGSQIITNRTEKDFVYNGKRVKKLSYLLIKGNR